MTLGSTDPHPSSAQDPQYHGPAAEASGDIILPEPVRRRVAMYAAQALRGLPPAQVPAAWRFATRFRPGSMPRGLPDRLVPALADDPELRQLLGAQLAAADPLGQAVAADAATVNSDAVGLAALLYLTQPADWRPRLQSVIAAMSVPEPAGEVALAQREAAELRFKLEKLQHRRDREWAQAQRNETESRARHAEALDRLREQLVAQTAAQLAASAARDQLQREGAELAREVRRMRAQVEQAGAQADHRRQTDRDSRLAATARAKALLEVLQGAVGGLADELGLPSKVVAPADLVAAAGPSQPMLSKRLAASSALAQALTMPRCHLIVDGYNVSIGTWPNLPLSQQRERLIAGLSALQARTGAEMTVVFDGADVGTVPAVVSRVVRVRFSEPGELADRVIVRLVAAEPRGRPIVVASSDAALTSGARAAGARSADREVLADLLGTGR